MEVVAIVNSYVVDLKGASVDAERFARHANQWVQSGKWEFATNSEFFIQFIGTIFLVFGPSEFIATQFGLLALFISGAYFSKILNLLGHSLPWWGILAFFLWPSLLSRVTTTMREPYLILFLVLMTYFAAQYKVTGRTNEVIKIVIVGILALLFHKAYAILAIVTLVYIVFFVMEPGVTGSRSKIFFIRIALMLVGGMGIHSILLLGTSTTGLAPLIAAVSGDTEYITQVLDYKTSREFRTTYDAALDFSSPLAFFASCPQVVVYYLFAPFPWRVSNSLDVLATIEGLFRLGGTWIIVRNGFMRKTFPHASRPVFVIAMILVLIWAAGTANYGTASRHNITTNWVFLMAYILRFSTPKRGRPNRKTY